MRISHFKIIMLNLKKTQTLKEIFFFKSVVDLNFYLFKPTITC